MTSEEDIVVRLRRTRANMIGTDDEGHYWDVHEATGEIEKLRSLVRFQDRVVRSGDTDSSGQTCRSAGVRPWRPSRATADGHQLPLAPEAEMSPQTPVLIETE